MVAEVKKTEKEFGPRDLEAIIARGREKTSLTFDELNEALAGFAQQARSERALDRGIRQENSFFPPLDGRVHSESMDFPFLCNFKCQTTARLPAG